MKPSRLYKEKMERTCHRLHKIATSAIHPKDFKKATKTLVSNAQQNIQDDFWTVDRKTQVPPGKKHAYKKN